MKPALSGRWALVTGTSTGIGRAITLSLARQGVHVFAGIRREADGQTLTDEASRSGASGQVIPLPLDVTREQDIELATERVSASVGENGLWALINNAGIVIPGPIEYLSLSEWRRQFDVNFFGMVELTRRALPLLRRAVKTLGAHAPRVMLVSSIGGRISQPIMAPYTSSKFATTALGDALRLELRRQGIGVTVLEPGAVATAIWEKGDDSARQFGSGHPARPLYGPEIDGLAKAARNAARTAIPAETAAEIAVRALSAERAPARILVGRDAKIAATLARWLPRAWFDSLLLQQYGVGKLDVQLQADAHRAG
jgi:NAD(P)-dependent dehydrogenase (short-subunit alcohol dehydrogenase family)